MAAKSCPKCGGSVSPASMGGLCPACLMGVANDLPLATELEDRSPVKERRFGDYVLGRQLGSGGMGVVYEAHQNSLNRKVALKFIRDSQVASPTLLRRFTIEAEATARLHHPGIVGIHEIGEVEGQPYFSMDLVEGDSLRSAMARGRFAVKPPEGSQRSLQVEIARLMAQTARAVHHAHQRGVLHRDLKPANILVDHYGEPHLTDFGLAKILRQTTGQDTKQSLTGSGDVAGTPSYMSPEQASSEEATSASDIYGLGAVLYELLTNQPPFKAPTALETLKQVQAQPPRRPRALNPLVDRNLETICLKCLEKDPRYRYASAEALAEDLERWIEHKPIMARPPGAAVRVQQWTQRNPAGAALIATLFAGLAATLVLLTVNQAQKRRGEVQEAKLIGEKISRMEELWRDTNRLELRITADDLAILALRELPDDPPAISLTFGAIVTSDPINQAQQTYAPLFPGVQAAMGRELKKPVGIDLLVFRRGGPEFGPISTNQVDLMLMDALAYVEARQRNSSVTPVALLNRRPTGAIITHTNTGIRQLSELKGRSLVFPELSSPLSIWAKARLVDAGIMGKDLSLITSILGAGGTHDATPLRADLRFAHRATSEAVLKRQVDIAITPFRRYDLDKQYGLVRLAELQSTPEVIVARAGLDSRIMKAFQSALTSGRTLQDLRKERDQIDWEEDSFPGAVAVDDAYFNDLRETMRKAARFDGESGPFPPNPSATREVRK